VDKILHDRDGPEQVWNLIFRHEQVSFWSVLVQAFSGPFPHL
jgi:hypothetical protein